MKCRLDVVNGVIHHKILIYITIYEWNDREITLKIVWWGRVLAFFSYIIFLPRSRLLFVPKCSLKSLEKSSALSDLLPLPKKMLSSGLRRLGRPAAQLGVRCVGSVPEKNPDNIAKVSYMILGWMEQIRAYKWDAKEREGSVRPSFYFFIFSLKIRSIYTHTV